MKLEGVMEHIYGFDYTQISKWTMWMLNFLFREWSFLLQLNEARLADHALEHCRLVGEKMGFTNPAQCRMFLAVDGVFVYVTISIRRKRIPVLLNLGLTASSTLTARVHSQEDMLPALVPAPVLQRLLQGTWHQVPGHHLRRRPH